MSGIGLGWLSSRQLAFDMWSKKSTKYDAAEAQRWWDHLFDSPPDRIGVGTLYFLGNEVRSDWDAEYHEGIENRINEINAKAAGIDGNSNEAATRDSLKAKGWAKGKSSQASAEDLSISFEGIKDF